MPGCPLRCWMACVGAETCRGKGERKDRSLSKRAALGRVGMERAHEIRGRSDQLGSA